MNERMAPIGVDRDSMRCWPCSDLFTTDSRPISIDGSEGRDERGRCGLTRFNQSPGPPAFGSGAWLRSAGCTERFSDVLFDHDVETHRAPAVIVERR